MNPEHAHSHGGRPTPAEPAKTPPHPLTLDGSALLHQMFRVRRAAWRALDAAEQAEIAAEAAAVFAAMEEHNEGGSALFAQLGHKGDLLIPHFRKNFEGLNKAELKIASLALNDYLEPTCSYLSTVELGLYDSTVKLYESLKAAGVRPQSDEWKARVTERMSEQAEVMAPRLFPRVPPHRYLCFYPMDKKRGENRNWYTAPIEQRRDMMREHGMIGRGYAGRVKQIISGSIGFDDWEWGVDLFADDPKVFKQLIYEMRFDEASAVYAAFGPFYIGIRFAAGEIGKVLAGEPPAYGPRRNNRSQASPRTAVPL